MVAEGTNGKEVLQAFTKHAGLANITVVPGDEDGFWLCRWGVLPPVVVGVGIPDALMELKDYLKEYEGDQSSKVFFYFQTDATGTAAAKAASFSKKYLQNAEVTPFGASDDIVQIIYIS